MPELGDPNDTPKLTVGKGPDKTDANRPSAVAPPFNVDASVYKEIAQSLLTARQNARSIESGAGAFLPLAGEVTRDKLLHIQSLAEQISRMVQEIYNEIAVTAFNN